MERRQTPGDADRSRGLVAAHVVRPTGDVRVEGPSGRIGEQGDALDVAVHVLPPGSGFGVVTGSTSWFVNRHCLKGTRFRAWR